MGTWLKPSRVVAIVQGVEPTVSMESGPLSTETIVTPIPRRLLITKQFQFLSAACTSPAGIRYFLTLDGVPVGSSVQVTGGGSLSPGSNPGVLNVVILN